MITKINQSECWINTACERNVCWFAFIFAHAIEVDKDMPTCKTTNWKGGAISFDVHALISDNF